MDPIIIETNANGRRQLLHWKWLWPDRAPRQLQLRLSEHLSGNSLGAGRVSSCWKCTTLDDLPLSFCRRSEGGLIRLISLPGRTEPGRGRMGHKTRSAQRLPIPPVAPLYLDGLAAHYIPVGTGQVWLGSSNWLLLTLPPDIQGVYCGGWDRRLDISQRKGYPWSAGTYSQTEKVQGAWETGHTDLWRPWLVP